MFKISISDSLSATDSAVEIHSILSPFSKCETNLMKSVDGVVVTETYERKRFLIATQKSVAVYAQLTREYASLYGGNLLFTVYIEKIDTTGLFTPRNHQRLLIKKILGAYLKSCFSLNCNINVNIFAAPNPEYVIIVLKFNNF